MKFRINHVLFTVLLFSASYLNAESVQSQTLVVDNFNKKPVHVGAQHLHYVNTQEGYDVYYVKADLKLSRVPIRAENTNDKVLQLVFAIPPAFSWGNWLSVRREFQSPLNLVDYKGLTLDVRVDVPSPGAHLRITLSDLTDDPNEGDEMWWFDCDSTSLGEKTQGWVQIYVPFDRFRIAYGEGTRHNDRKMNPAKVIAYEINLLSSPGDSLSGTILLDYIRAYK